MLQIIKNLRIVPITRRSVVNIRWFSDEDSSDDEKKRNKSKNAKIKSNEAIKRLNELLGSMPTSNASQKINIITAKNKKQESRDEQKQKVDEEDPKDLKSITQTIARKIGGDVQKTESELLSALLGTSSDQKSNLSDIYGGLKIETDRPKKYPTKAQSVRNAMGKSKQPGVRSQFDRSQKQTIVNLFGGKPMNIFKEASNVPDPLETWRKLENRELKLAVTHPPRNYFEKMIIWTEQGKVWKFPIDNEQGMEEEKQTDFTEHVLLEMHLDGWCPTRGPIRHFMELVCVGLSKNCFLTANEKRDHIMWYKDYFESKSDVLGELLTLGISEADKTKQIESTNI